MKSRLIVLLIRLLARLPLRWGARLGTLLGRLNWRTRGRMARTTGTNIALCFPELDGPTQAALSRHSLEHIFRTFTEAGAIWLWPAERTLGLIREVDGLNLLQQAHAEGKGVIMLSPHVGNWELMGLFMNTCGLGQTSQLYQAPTDPALAELLFTARSRTGARMVATDKKGVAELLQGLRRGEVIGILPDQVPDESGGEFAPFFGIPALTMTLCTRLLQKTGARAVICAAVRTEDRPGFRLVFREPDPKIYAQHMPEALAGLNSSLEALIREFPEQYHWEYKRYKRQPPGRQRPY
jgi:Kdo2-lipid IVA lauroyltransferase/acyltransferase